MHTLQNRVCNLKSLFVCFWTHYVSQESGCHRREEACIHAHCSPETKQWNSWSNWFCPCQRQISRGSHPGTICRHHLLWLGRVFFVSRRIASSIHEISNPPKKLSCSVFGPHTIDPECKKKTLSTRGLDKTSLNHSVYVVLPSRRAEEFKEKYLKKGTNEACVLVRCISWHDCGVSSDVRANIIVCAILLSDIKHDSS